MLQVNRLCLARRLHLASLCLHKIAGGEIQSSEQNSCETLQCCRVNFSRNNSWKYLVGPLETGPAYIITFHLVQLNCE